MLEAVHSIDADKLLIRAEYTSMRIYLKVKNIPVPKTLHALANEFNSAMTKYRAFALADVNTPLRRKMIKENETRVRELLDNANSLGHDFVLTGQNKDSILQNIYICRRCSIDFNIIADLEKGDLESYMWNSTTRNLGIVKCAGGRIDKMTSKQKIIEIRRLLSAEEMAKILDVSIATTKSWTKSQKGARVPGKENADKIDDLHEKLKPCFERIEEL